MDRPAGSQRDVRMLVVAVFWGTVRELLWRGPRMKKAHLVGEPFSLLIIALLKTS